MTNTKNPAWRVLLVASSEEAASRFARLLAHDEGVALSAGGLKLKVEVFPGYALGKEAFEQALLKSGGGLDLRWDTVLIVKEGANTAAGDEEALALVARAVSRVSLPVVVAADDEGFVSACRSRGAAFFLPSSDVSERVLFSLMHSAADYARLTRSVLKSEEMYRLAEKRFRDVAEAFSDWLWEVDADLTLVFSSARKRHALKVTAGASFKECFLEQEAGRLEEEFDALFKDPQAFQDLEFWGEDAFGGRTCWSLSGVPVFDEQGRFSGFRGVGKDVSMHKASADQLYYLSNNDTLTGLYNRARFTDEMVRVARHHRRAGKDGGLILLNIDRFRYVNDTYGHGTGDKLIVHVAQLLKGALRRNDFIARIGADEFAILVPDATADEVKKRAAYLLHLINEHRFMHAGVMLTATASAGVVFFPTYGETADELLARANIALYQAKHNGANCVQVFDDSQLRNHDVSRRMEILDLLFRCITESPERIIIHYQPIVSLSDEHYGRVERYEVLVRLLDDEGQIVSPVRFIEPAEEFGLIARLDKIVVMRSIDLLESWQKNGRKTALAVNLSGRSFEDEDLMEAIRARVEQAKLLPRTLILEITETASLKDMVYVRRVIGELKKLGAAFALDDCGVGYSSFNYIRQLDLDYIKIDGSFIRDLHRNKHDDVFVQALQDVASRMEILTVAEMVENPEIVERLKEIGINYAQGYYFGMPKAEVLEEDSVLH